MKGFWNMLFLFSILSLSACGGGKIQNQTERREVATDVTEVLYFHGKQRCVTCNAIELLTRQVVDSMADERVVMRIIDLSSPENESLADRYEATWSSLIVERNGRIERLSDMAFSHAKGQPEVFKAKLVESIVRIAQ